MRKKTFGELVKGDVWRIGGRKRIVSSDPVTVQGVTRFQTRLPDGREVGETASFSTDDANYWGREAGLKRHR